MKRTNDELMLPELSEQFHGIARNHNEVGLGWNEIHLHLAKEVLIFFALRDDNVPFRLQISHDCLVLQHGDSNRLGE